MKKGNIFAIFATILLTIGCTQVIPLDITETPKPDVPSSETVDIEMVLVKGGTFTMGATSEQGSAAYDSEKPAHQVTLSDFYIGKYEVTQAQWEAIMGSNPSSSIGNVLPVENVSWDDVQEFITKLNEKTGKKFRLPTEAEWEYAARGGNKSQIYKYSGGNNVEEVAWYNDNSGKTTHPVGHNRSNELGIYDMSGNVSEWCSDWYGSYSSDAQTNPVGPTTGSNRVARGGSCNDFANYCRVSYRSWGKSDYRGNNRGFRLACPANSQLTLTAPANLALTATDTTIEATWDAVVNTKEYVVEYKTKAATEWTALPAVTETKATITGLAFETEYEVRVKATADDVASDYSEVATITTLAESSAVNIGDFEMVFVEGGTFTMGGTSEQGSDANDNEKPTHQVTLSDFYIGKYEVTQAQWVAVMGSNPSYFTGDNLPVEQVSWNDIQEFITKLNEQTGKNFRLPTEAEWEYAARGGNKSKGYKYSGSNTIDEVAWYYSDYSSSATHPVGQKQPNELGLYDMSGNVYEWCYDWYGDYSSDSQTNPTGPSGGSYRVVRGGSWNCGARGCRVSDRNRSSADFRSYYYGFRLVCSPE